MYYGHAAEVAIRAALYLGGRPPGELSPVQDVADATKLPKAYLSKIVQRLAQAGLVRTFRGPGGGIQLGKSPEAITLWSLVHATEGRPDSDRCVLGIGTCSAANPCALHARWAPLRDESIRLLEDTTLAAVLQDLPKAQSYKQFAARRGGRTSHHEIASERQGRP
jgi:Rrf2 family transcriptional regulator, iron-sulfur cluster assembly transcription factor